MEQIWIASILFTAVVLVLVLIVVGARRLLVPSRQVAILLNGRRTVNVLAGEKLLQTLSEQGIYLPAACGGRGTCGQCKVKVLGEVRSPLPTEAAHLSRTESAAGVRLACLLTVRDELEIRVPDESLDARRWACTVRSNRNISTFMKELVLTVPAGEQLDFEAGEYLLLEAPPHDLDYSDFDIDSEYRSDWQRYQFFDLHSKLTEPAIRAYSLANHPMETRIVTLIVRIATPPYDAQPGTPPGKVSSYIFSLKTGDQVSLSGPFGEFHAQDTDKEMVFIAGGAGIAPMRSIICDQLLRVKTPRKISFWYGARSLPELCYQAEFDQLAAEYENFSWHVALSEPRPNDAWNGNVGFIHTVIYENYLKQHPAPEDAEFYLCGPPLMSTATVQMLEDLGVERDSIFLDDFGS
jgi:Na+-transporting NADH:ubiquinone oxidoreductase subunit F